MKAIGPTIADLDAFRRAWNGSALTAEPFSSPGRLASPPLHRPNPGKLRFLTYVPQRLAADAALVVVLHGCKQTAEDYDAGAGWSRLAERHGFVVLYPEQTSGNNPNLCFNWFDPRQTERGCGEARSIREMIRQVCAAHPVSRRRIFITGLSAGGAMAAAMLAAYPELFAGGAIIAGLPHGAAGSVSGAFRSMFEGAGGDRQELGEKVRAASPHRGPWPRISIWHGDADPVVVPANAEALTQQWLEVHGIDAAPQVDAIEGNTRRIWRDRDGAPSVQHIAITGMGHGVPIGPGREAEPISRAGPFLLDVGLCSTTEIAADWGLVSDQSKRSSASVAAQLQHERSPAPPRHSIDPSQSFMQQVRARLAELILPHGKSD